MGSDDQLQELVHRCQRGEQVAFEELFRQFQPRLRYYLRRLDAGGGHTEDLLQDVWVKVIRGIGSLKERRAFIAWLYTIARNEVYGRARIPDPFVGLSEEHLDLPAEAVEPTFTGEDAARLHQGLDRLRPHHREVLTLCFLEELPHQQVAQILGIRANTVRTRIYYAKQALRRQLEKSHE
jgi:RNA polymerase sigma-70 factor (ECF subfamily)